MYVKAEIQPLLRRIPWFLDLTPAQVDRLAEIATLHEYGPDEVLFKEGDREDYLYILLEGQVELAIEVPAHGSMPFYTAEALDVIGWSSLTPIVRNRTASARAVQRSQLIGLQSKLLEQLCEEDHDLGYVIMKRLSNLVANRLLTTRVFLMEILVHSTPQVSGFK